LHENIEFSIFGNGEVTSVDEAIVSCPDLRRRGSRTFGTVVIDHQLIFDCNIPTTVGIASLVGQELDFVKSARIETGNIDRYRIGNIHPTDVAHHFGEVCGRSGISIRIDGCRGPIIDLIGGSRDCSDNPFAGTASSGSLPVGPEGHTIHFPVHVTEEINRNHGGGGIKMEVVRSLDFKDLAGKDDGPGRKEVSSIKWVGTKSEFFRVAAPLPFDITELTLGSGTGGAESIQGIMDDYALFSRALTPEQIALLAEGTSAIDLVTPPKVVITDISVNPDNGQATMTWSSREGKTYSIFTSTDLVGNPATDWTELTDGFASGGDTTTFTDTFSGGGPVRFYVVIEN